MQVVTRCVVFFAADYGMHRTSLFPESCHNRDIPPTIFDLWDGQIPASERNILLTGWISKPNLWPFLHAQDA